MKFTSFAILLLAILFASCKKAEILSPEAASLAAPTGTPKTLTSTTITTNLTITEASLVLSQTAELTVNLEFAATGFTSRPPQSMGVELCRDAECYQETCTLLRTGANNSAVYSGSFTFSSALEIGQALAMAPTPPYTTRPRSRVINVQGGTDSH